MLPSDSVLRKLTGSLILNFFKMVRSKNAIMQRLEHSINEFHLLCSASDYRRRGALVPVKESMDA